MAFISNSTRVAVVNGAGTVIVARATSMKFAGAGVVVSTPTPGQALLTIAGGGGGGGWLTVGNAGAGLTLGTTTNNTWTMIANSIVGFTIDPAVGSYPGLNGLQDSGTLSFRFKDSFSTNYNAFTSVNVWDYTNNVQHLSLVNSGGFLGLYGPAETSSLAGSPLGVFGINYTANTAAAGSDVFLGSGDRTSTNAAAVSGDTTIFTGNSTGGASNASGVIISITGNAVGASGFNVMRSGNSTAGASGALNVNSGTGLTSGLVSVFSGIASAGVSGAVRMASGTGTTGTGLTRMFSGAASAGPSGNVLMFSGTGTTGSGSVSVTSGDASAGSSGATSFGSGLGTTGSGSSQLTTGNITGVGSSGVISIATGIGGGGTSTSGGIFAFTGATNNGISGTVGLSTGSVITTASGAITLATGLASGAGNSGLISLDTGSTSSLASGLIRIKTGNTTTATSGTVDIVSGNSTSFFSGAVSLKSGTAAVAGNSGIVTISSGDSSGNASGGVNINTGACTTNNTGTVSITSGNAFFNSGQINLLSGTAGAGANTGSVSIKTGVGSGAGTFSGGIDIHTGTNVGGTRGIIDLKGLRTQVSDGPLLIAAPTGSGYTFYFSQTADPISPGAFAPAGNGFNLFADSLNKFCWIATDGFYRRFDDQSITANREWVTPNLDGTLELSTGTPLANQATSFGPAAYVLGTTEAILYVDTSGGAVTVQLPNPNTCRKLKIKDIGSSFAVNNATLLRFGAENIEGVAASYVLGINGQAWEVQSDGTNWWFTNLP